MTALVAIVAVAAADSVVAQVSRLQMVSGDRQIVVNSILPNTPYVVRALDGGGKPVQGANLIIQTSGGGDGVTLRDEFGFLGFNAVPASLPRPGGPLPEYVATTDVSGSASGHGRYTDFPSSAFLVAASNYGPQDAFPPAFFSVVMLAATAAGNPTVVVEYFEEEFGHYFNTSMQGEIDALEANRFPGWHRSIGSFVAYATAQEAPVGAVPVCRFFSSTYTAHFYTASVDECDAVAAKWSDIWVLETRAAFYMQVPDPVSGACGAGLQPVYRLYSTRNGPNHRYVADRSLRDAMVRSGWVAEGYGPDAVMLCTAK